MSFKCIITTALVVAVLIPSTAALAKPSHDHRAPAKQPAEAPQRDHRPGATPQSITFTNPLGKSRGPGASAGLL